MADNTQPVLTLRDVFQLAVGTASLMVAQVAMPAFESAGFVYDWAANRLK